MFTTRATSPSATSTPAIASIGRTSLPVCASSAVGCIEEVSVGGVADSVATGAGVADGVGVGGTQWSAVPPGYGQLFTHFVGCPYWFSQPGT
jgi:hypothetical protein